MYSTEHPFLILLQPGVREVPILVQVLPPWGILRDKHCVPLKCKDIGIDTIMNSVNNVEDKQMHMYNCRQNNG